MLTSDNLHEAISSSLLPYLKVFNRNPEMSPNQQLVAALLNRAHQEYNFYGEHTGYWTAVRAILRLFIALAGVAGSIITTFWAAHFLHLDVLLYALTLILLGLVFLLIKEFNTTGVTLSQTESKQYDKLYLGRLRYVLHGSGVASVLLVVLATVMVCETALILFTSDHLSFTNAESFETAVELTLRSAFHYPLGYVEPFTGKMFHERERSQHGLISATVLAAFRAVYDGWFLVLAYTMYRRFRLRHIYGRYPQIYDGNQLSALMANLSRDQSNWGRILHDESISTQLQDTVRELKKIPHFTFRLDGSGQQTITWELRD